MNESYKKYFVIGFNKTATCTFHDLFLKNKLTSQHATRWNTDNYTCFSDNGHLNDYKKLDLKYKNSIFILNVRELDKKLILRIFSIIMDQRKTTVSYENITLFY